MRVSVIGTGYVGLVTGAGLAEKGHYVTCVDTDAAKIAQIRRGAPAFYEPGLEELLRRNSTRLEATTDLRRAVFESDLSFIAVGTPVADGQIDLGAVRAATRQIGSVLREKPTYHLVVVKSTVVPGTTEQVVLPLLEEASGKKAGVDFGVGTNPEFLTEGEAVQDFLCPDRLVLGTLDASSLAALEALYAPFGGERVRTTPRTAEMIKYTANCLLATTISFSNEIGNLCSALGGIDVAEVMRGVHASKYLTVTPGDGRRPALEAFLWAGCGFGGSCLPKDLQALIACGKRAGEPMALLRAVVEVNERQPEQVVALVRRHFPSLVGVRVAVLGLAFRPGTSDMRESPAIPIVRRLLAEGVRVSAYDPAARDEARRVFAEDRVHLCEDLASAVSEADAAVLVTRWEEFRRLPDVLRATGRTPLLVDGRRMLEKTAYDPYEGIGL
ncbi:MAG: GDP-mannose dehydrogenase [Gemmatimonadetes bacterium]|nr:MAG: GDP-mannose dehydrogenase [Gemmatimonadota bacterium]